MNSKQFEKLLMFESLARDNKYSNYMFKVYLNVLLKGGKIWEPNFMYSCFRLGYSLEEDHELKFEKEDAKKSLIHYFEEVVKKGSWELKNTTDEYYDENNNKVSIWDDDFDNKIISKKVETTVKTTYYMDDSRKIKKYEVSKDE